ncbi:hypothetical protein ACJIZ3_007517 [Penstemon smallii]|uniref:Serine-rich protein-like protein n=1 Tax=Penstemon smallii TaxID=265156 RepID=A0ABD3SAS6_9LAMI
MAEEESSTISLSDQKHSSSKAKIFVPNLSLDTMKAAAPPSRLSSSIPSSPVVLRKAASVRQNCLCSPTTHAGSFRCRYHRNNNSSSGGLTRNGMSVGSKLSELAVCTL